jgi:hypothetical protein
MGARNLNRVQYTLERDVVRIWGRFTGAGTSNPTSVKGKGITSVTRTAASTYAITLADTWAGLLMFKASVIDAGTIDDWEVVVASETVASTKIVTINVFKGGTGSTTGDLPTTAKLLFEITVSNNSQKPVGF